MRIIVTSIIGAALLGLVTAGVREFVRGYPTSYPSSNSTNAVLRASVLVNKNGTGVLLRRGGRSWVLTAGHCVGSLWSDELMATQEVSQIIYRGSLAVATNNYTASVANYDYVNDLALLLLKENVEGDLIFADPDVVPPLGTPLIHVGNLFGKYERSFVVGVLSGYDRIFDGLSYWQTSVTAFPGSSGGGMYTVNGHYIGMITQGAQATVNFIIPLSRIHAWAVDNGLEWLFDPAKPVIMIRP